MVIYDLDEPYRNGIQHGGGGGSYRKLRGYYGDADSNDEEDTRQSRIQEISPKQKFCRGGCRGRIYFFVALLTVVACLYLLAQSRSFQKILHPAKIRQAPKLILIWDRNSQFLEVKPYREKKEIPRKGLQNAYAGCNCEVTSDAGAWKLADAILVNAFYLRRINDFSHFFPKRRIPRQLWVFYMLEPAQIITENRDKGFFYRLNGQFNLTMTYRLDSDVPAAYGQMRQYYVDDDDRPGADTLENETAPEFRDYAQGKTHLVAWFASNCGAKSGRMEYVRELQKHISVDIYGDCGSLKCPNDTVSDCNRLLRDHYKFYLSFESSVCRDYITEKFFKPLEENVVPIVLGGGNYSAINVPKNAFIDVRDFPTVKQLADYLLYLDATPNAYNEYFQWKQTLKVKRSGVYTRSLCDLCDKLNEIDAAPKFFHQIYPDMTKWWHEDAHCLKGSVLNGSWITL